MNILKKLAEFVTGKKNTTGEGPKVLTNALVVRPTDGWYRYRGRSGLCLAVGGAYYLRSAPESLVPNCYRVYEQAPNEELIDSYIDEIHVAKTAYMTDCWEFINE